MTKDTAQRLQGAIGLVGLLGVAGVKLYVIGWLDDWWIVALVAGSIISGFAVWWVQRERRVRRERDELNSAWEARQKLRRTPSEDRREGVNASPRPPQDASPANPDVG